MSVRKLLTENTTKTKKGNAKKIKSLPILGNQRKKGFYGNVQLRNNGYYATAKEVYLEKSRRFPVFC